MDFQIGLLPHLISLKEGYGTLRKEVDKYTEAGWYGLFSHPPFLPFSAVPKGSVPCKLEPGRPRPTTEAGAPCQMLVDSEQQCVISLNEASSGMTTPSVVEVGVEAVPTPAAGRRPQWPNENKPTVADVISCITLLTAVGLMTAEPLYTAADDFKSFFKQLQLAPEEFWKCGMMLS